ncbi:hypothetical protein G7Z17_g3472 [Cylindrodendrum hubeiense]|uniref:non-specific serine/threonine protein kinase n=1 Tax=Cylindrodendrum hubeiense TaxID=595255 RepID=A0A9P5LJX9_9HYPO|nr:hypothetical protein G7Z17_g3472 [Cylindrodendrum hubeiense]
MSPVYRDLDFDFDTDTDDSTIDVDDNYAADSALADRQKGRRYVSVQVIFISWVADQQTEHGKHIHKVRNAAEKIAYKDGSLDGTLFREIYVDASNAQQFQDCVNSSLLAANAAGNLVVIVYLGGVRYLSGAWQEQSSIAHIHPLRTTSLWGMRGINSITWDLKPVNELDVDVLFMTNFSSREFLRCLRFNAHEPDMQHHDQHQHRLELLTFCSNDAEGFAKCLREFNRKQADLEKSKPLGYSLSAVCRRFEKHTRARYPTEISPRLRKLVGSVHVRRDIISGTKEIWLAGRYPIFSPEHVTLATNKYSKQPSLLVQSPAGSHAKIWKMYLDYQSNISDPLTVGTICVAVKSFVPPTSDTTRRRQFKSTFDLELRNLNAMMKWPHRNILAKLGSFVLEKGGLPSSFNLIFPLATGGNLETFMSLPISRHADPEEPYPIGSYLCEEYGAWEHGVLDECVGLLDALAYIHHGLDGNIIIHRDIKPANILIHERRFKLADFGASSIKSSVGVSATARWAATETYSPPELFTPSGGGENDRFGRARDVWSLGCVLLELAVMLAESQHPDVMPSVDGFKAKRLKTSTDRGDTHTTQAFALTMSCVRDIAGSVTQLHDAHISCLKNVAMLMLNEDYKDRPQALDMHQRMKRAYMAIDPEFHIPNDTPTGDVSQPYSETLGLDFSTPNVDDLARFWYTSFWHNNIDRFYSRGGASTSLTAPDDTANSTHILDIEDVDAEEGEDATSSRRGQRRWFTDNWNSARAGAKAGVEISTWMRKRLFPLLLVPLVYTQTLVDTVANLGAQMEHRRRQRIFDQDQGFGRTGAIHL